MKDDDGNPGTSSVLRNATETGVSEAFAACGCPATGTNPYHRMSCARGHYGPIALMPSRKLVNELRALASREPDVARLGRGVQGPPQASAVVKLLEGFEVVAVPLPGSKPLLFVGRLPGAGKPRVAVDVELDALVAFDVQHLFCLVPEVYLTLPSVVPKYLEEATSRFGQRFRHLEIVDYEVPGDDRAFEDAVEAACDALTAGEKVFVHCYAGCGRAGTFASCLLVRRGGTALEAVTRFREVQGCGPETSEQVAYVFRYAARLAAR